MMGSNCESILSGVTKIKESLDSAVISLANELSNSIVSIDTSISVDGDSHTGSLSVSEKEKASSASSYFSTVKSAISASSSVMGQMSSLGNNMYTSSDGFNNSYGSPWTEMTKLNSVLSSVETYIGLHSNMRFVGEKSALMGLLTMASSACVDAKWALITYNDYLQRGFDNKYNDNNASITFARTKDRRTTGNITQSFTENVHIAEESIDPY
jgi:hypothetical protein